MKKLILWVLIPVLFAATPGDEKKSKEWKVADAHGPTTDITFDTDEGTWMSLDISPDGKDIVFDMLGDIYTMPIAGGEAKLLSGGTPWEVQPRFSPDGSKISFTSDRDGGDNIWIMSRDGSKAHALTKESFRLLNNAVWTPDGSAIIARKHFTSGRSLGAGEMWMYYMSGGSGLQLTKRRNDQQDEGEPAISPDGKFVYWSADVAAGGYFQYNKDPNGEIYVIHRLNRETGKIDDVIAGAGGACRPQPSHNGNLLAFVRRVRLKSVLFLHDLRTGEEWPLYDKLDKDQQETWATFGVYPNYSFTPDDKNIVIWAKGKIWKVEVATGKAINIPFNVKVKQTITEAVKFQQEVSPENFESKMIRQAETSPDGKWLAFNAVGHIWLKELPNGKPERLTNEQNFEFAPSWSNDGKTIVYTTWDDSLKGNIYKISIGSKKPVKLSRGRGYYHTPHFSADGKKIVYQKAGGDDILGFSYGLNTGLYWMDADGVTAHLITEEGSEPFFNKDATRIYYSNGKTLKSVNLNGNDVRVHFTSQYAKDYTPSPDGKWIAYTDLFQGYVAPLSETGSPIDLNGKTDAYPIYNFTRDAGTSLHWSGDSKTLHWLIGPEYFSRKVADCFTYFPGAKDSLAPKDSVGIKIGLTMKTDIPDGKIALKGARIISMKDGAGVIEDGTILIEKNRIKAIGSSASITIPAGYKIMDVTGKTIMPGIVDVHAHMGQSGTGISPQQQWSYYANVAYGVTTTHDPSANTEMIFSQSEMQKAGVIVAPRIYSTGSILYGADGDFKVVINNIDDARSHLRRLKASGAFSVKSYNQPRRNQRQMIIQAARELHMLVVPEGGSFFNMNMNEIMDGHTGIEHSIPIAPLYKDVIKFWASTKTSYTPTLIVSYGGLWGENYWYQHTKVYENKRLLTYYPRAIIDSRSRRPTITTNDDSDWGFMANARSAADLYHAGVKVQLGAHGQLHGLGAHWEMWMFTQGGMTNLEAIRSATLSGAEYIGMEKEIGSLEEGKLADLVIMDKNPLEDIHNSESISYVMLNGRLYDAANMNEVGNHPKKRHKFFWEYDRSPNAFPWHAETNSFMDGCGLE